MQNSPEFKKAAIDWLLANGTCDSMTTSTRLALADLAVRGVDYEDSETPDFGTGIIGPRDTFHEATYGEAFKATVYPRNRDKSNWREGYEFQILKADIERLLLSQMIMGVIKAAESGDADWKARADQREIERMERHLAATELRAQREHAQQEG